MTSDKTGTHTRWIRKLQEGEEGEVQEKVWNAYFEQLVGLARHKLGRSPKTDGDEEDVALDALNSFFVRIKRGEFPDLRDRTGLWPLLMRITARKASNRRRHANAQKRSPGEDQAILRDDDDHRILEEIVGSEPSPEFAYQSFEAANQLLSELDDDRLRETAVLKLQGYTNREIAEQCDVLERTIERRLVLIRKKWSTEEDD